MFSHLKIEFSKIHIFINTYFALQSQGVVKKNPMPRIWHLHMELTHAHTELSNLVGHIVC